MKNLILVLVIAKSCTMADFRAALQRASPGDSVTCVRGYGVWEGPLLLIGDKSVVITGLFFHAGNGNNTSRVKTNREVSELKPAKK